MSEYIQNQQIEIRPSGQHFSVDIVLAAHYGLEEAFLIHHFQYWIRINKTKNHNFRDGNFWTYQTIKDIAAHFPFLNYEKVKYAIENLIKQKVLKIGNFNKLKMDKTNWYAFVREDIFVPEMPLKSKNVYERENSPSIGKIPSSIGKIPEPIPDTNSMTKTSSLKDNVFCKEKNEDFEKEKSKYPLKKEQIPIFEEMKALELGCSDEVLKIIIREQIKLNKLDFLSDCLHHVRFKIDSGFQFKKERIAFLRNCLSGKQFLITKQCLENKAAAERYCKKTGWNDVKITEKYAAIVDASGNILKEVSMNLPEKEFQKQFINLRKLSEEYQNR